MYAYQGNTRIGPWYKIEIDMVRVDKAFEAFVHSGADFFTGVPDSLLKDICAYITDNAAENKHIIAANEGAAVGIAAGYHMATGKVPVVYMQNSGLGNTVNPLMSLADEKVYGLPVLLMIGWRGEPGTKDEPQHLKQGAVTLDLLDTMQIPYLILDDDESVALRQISAIVEQTGAADKPHAIIIRKGLFGKYELKKKDRNDNPLSREEALKIVVDNLGSDDVVVSTTGKLSRELFEYRETKAQGHERDFLTVGSMGYSSSIALGIALANNRQQVYCLDGDGAFIMHLGALTNIGNTAPANFKHILFNNGAHESVGGQPTLGFAIDVKSIVKACGYKTAITAITREEIAGAMHRLSTGEGPALLEIRVKIQSRDDLGRPTTTPIENKIHFMNHLKK